MRTWVATSVVLWVVPFALLGLATISTHTTLQLWPSVMSDQELQDLALWLMVLLVTLACGAWSVVRRTGAAEGASAVTVGLVPLTAILLTFVAGVGITSGLDFGVPLWRGFGWAVGAVAAVTSYVVMRLISRWPEGLTTRRTRRLLEAGLWIAAGIVYLPSVLQPPNALIDNDSSAFVINEVAGPLAGWMPFSGQAAQYTNLLGLLPALLQYVPGVGPMLMSEPDAVIVWLLSILAVLTLVLLVLLGRATTLRDGSSPPWQ